MNVAPAEPPRGGTTKFTYASGSRPLDGYTIKRGVGRGGFGEVYYATSDGGKEVALKLVRRNLDIELRGAQHCLNLKHPHLIGLYDIRRDQHDDSWVVMEFVRGDSLEDAVGRHPTGMPEELALWWFQGMAAGVAYLHDQGIVHRDLKPGNIFNDEGVVKIGDYGLSKFISASRRSGQTESVGTVHYMAPEIANGRYGKEIDVYALGIVLYEMLTGHVPFEGESVGEVLMKHLTAQPDLSKVREPYRAAIARALTKDPQQRFASVGEFLAAIGIVGATAAAQGPAPTATASARPQPQPPPRVAAASPMSVPLVSPTSTSRLDIGRCFNDAFAVYKDNWLVLAGATALLEILSPLTLGILAGPLTGGYCLMLLRAHYHPTKRVEFGDLFSGFSQFGRLVGLFYLTIVPLILGFFALFVPFVLLSTIWMFAWYLVVDRNHGVFQSLGTSYRIVNRRGFGINLLLVVISLLLVLAATAIPWLGFILGWFIVPFASLLTMSAYVQQVREDNGELNDLLDTPPGQSPMAQRPAGPMPAAYAASVPATVAEGVWAGDAQAAAPQAAVPHTPPEPASAAPPVRRSERLRRMQMVSALAAKTPKEKLTELLGSLLLSAAVAMATAVVLSLLALNFTRNVDVGDVLWLGGVGAAGAWGVLVPAKFWEGTQGEPILRRFAMLCVGLALGLVALGLGEALVVDLLPIRDLDPRIDPKAHGMANEALYVAYFTFLMPVLRWWRQADPLRRSRFSFWSTVVCVGWAMVLSMAWPFPQPWGMMAAATIAVSVQLAAPWADRRRLVLAPVA